MKSHTLTLTPRFQPTLFSLVLGLLFMLLASVSPASAQERSLTTPTGWYWLHGASADQVGDLLSETHSRLIDIEVEQTSPLRFTVVMVKNQGPYASGWWWYYNATAASLADKLQDHQARILALEPYAVGDELRFAAILVPNTGTQAKAWWWYFNASTEDIGSLLDRNEARLIDIDPYTLDGQSYYSAVMIANIGADAKAWWWYHDVNAAFVSSRLQMHGARLVDIERNSASLFTVVMEESEGQGWWWYYGVDAGQVGELAAQNGARLIDLEPYTSGGEKRFQVIMLNNSNALTTRIGDMLRDNTDGASGLYLKEVDGPVLAGLQEKKVFEPASAIKVLIHLHAMLQVQNGLPLTTDVPWLADPTKFDAQGNYQPGGSDCYSNNTVPMTSDLDDALRMMMQNSDNALTQALRDFFGDTNINATRQMLGMNDTALNHSIGCGTAAVQNHNKLTLVDVGRLHEAVADGLLTPVNRSTFYNLMTTSVFFSAIITQEAQALGLTNAEETAFRSYVNVATKGGSYGLSDGLYVSLAGWVSLPFATNGRVGYREYVFGVFVDGATTLDQQNTGTNLSTGAVSAELFREQIRAALQTFK